MPILVERKLFKIGEGGIAVTLPKAWINYYGLKPGDKVEVIAESEITIRVRPNALKDKEVVPENDSS